MFLEYFPLISKWSPNVTLSSSVTLFCVTPSEAICFEYFIHSSVCPKCWENRAKCFLLGTAPRHFLPFSFLEPNYWLDCVFLCSWRLFDSPWTRHSHTGDITLFITLPAIMAKCCWNHWPCVRCRWSNQSLSSSGPEGIATWTVGRLGSIAFSHAVFLKIVFKCLYQRFHIK